jgi:hypothetical protein
MGCWILIFGAMLLLAGAVLILVWRRQAEWSRLKRQQNVVCAALLGAGLALVVVGFLVEL